MTTSTALNKYTAEIKFWSLILVLGAFVCDVIHFMLFGHSRAVAMFWTDRRIDEVLLQLNVPLTWATIFILLMGWRPLMWRKVMFLIGIGVALVAGLWVLGAPYVFHSVSVTISVLLLPLAYWLGLTALYDLWFSPKVVAERVPASWVPVFLWIAVAVTGVVVLVGGMLRINMALLPQTFDAHLFKIDAAFGGGAEWAAQWYRDEHGSPQWLHKLVYGVYDLLGFLMFPMLALLMREYKAHSLHGWRIFVLPYIIAMLCYAWLPATGPIYSLADYPYGMTALEMPANMMSVGFAPRNAMPSLHVSTAIWFLMMAAALQRKWIFALTVVFLLGTIWATLALGEHYIIDVIVAIPFAIALGLWLINPPRWRQAPRWARVLQWGCGGSFLLWMVLLRLVPVWLQEHLIFVQALAIWSVLLGLVLLTSYIRFVWSDKDTSENLLPHYYGKSWKAPTVLPEELHGNRWLVGIFFFSGLAGLLYEVVYAKALGVTFGGTSLAAKTVLMTYMGGMALGAWLGGMLAERTRRPLLWYAYFEAAIGLYAAVTPLLFSGIQSIYVALAVDSPPDAAWLTTLRMGLGAGVLGVPTVLMGATLPLVFQCLRGMGIPTARAIAPLYGANVLGAAAGALLAGYALLPAVGRNGGTLLAAVISLMVALYVIDKIKRGADFGNGSGTAIAGAIEQNSALKGVSSRQGLAALGVLLVGGVVTLALEVVFMHLLAVVAGNSVYAFGLMLATFLLGLGLGSTVGERLMLRVQRSLLVGWAQAGIALAILLTAFVWDGLANYMGSFQYAAQNGLILDFAGRELVRALVCALAMMPPAFFIGMSYPAAMGLAADWVGRDGRVARGVGIASGINTLGNISGVLLAGFWLLPAFGSRNVLLGLAVVALILAVVMVWSNESVEGTPLQYFWRGWAPVGAVAAALMLFPSQWNYTALSQGGNVYFQPQAWGEVIDHAESVEGGLTTVARGPSGALTLLTNGKFQGNNSEKGEMVAQESFALIPLLHTAQRDNALVIGYGTGMTARVLQDQGFVEQDVVELSRDIVMMADKHFSNINERISANPTVRMHYTDGRNYLLTQSKQFDLISLEITSIWFAGAANLYNREFYELADMRLRPKGVLQQWVQLHHMRPIDFMYVLGSVRSVFKHVWIYVSGGQGIIVASNDDAAINNQAAVQKLLSGHTISNIDVNQLPGTLVASPAQVNAVLKRYDPSMSFFISTDKNLYLEYATPKGNAMQKDSMAIIIEMLEGKL